MFRTDFIPYKIIPVSGFNELSAANEDHVQGHEDVLLHIKLRDYFLFILLL